MNLQLKFIWPLAINFTVHLKRFLNSDKKWFVFIVQNYSKTRHNFSRGPSFKFSFFLTATWKHPSPSTKPVTQFGSSWQISLSVRWTTLASPPPLWKQVFFASNFVEYKEGTEQRGVTSIEKWVQRDLI